MKTLPLILLLSLGLSTSFAVGFAPDPASAEEHDDGGGDDWGGDDDGGADEDWGGEEDWDDYDPDLDQYGAAGQPYAVCAGQPNCVRPGPAGGRGLLK